MTSALARLIRARSAALAPEPTGVDSSLARLEGIRAVLFDIYGTLVISASGDIDTVPASRARAFGEALRAVGVASTVRGETGSRLLLDAIRAEHARLRADDIAYPEVDILALWRAIAPDLGVDPARVDLARLAVEFEVRVNPVWEMPGARRCIEALHARGLALGIVSNAQAFTPDVVEALLGAAPDALGFAADLQLYSYRHHAAKPGGKLFELACAALARRGVSPAEALYVGNDMLNDVMPAQRAGLRTGLFAGDVRSLRLRTGDPRIAGVQPDLVVTALEMLPGCIARR